MHAASRRSWPSISEPFRIQVLTAGYGHTPQLHDEAGRSAEIRGVWGPNGRLGSPTRLCTLDINRICPHGRLDRGVSVRGFHEGFAC